MATCGRIVIVTLYMFLLIFCVLRQTPWATCTPLEPRQKRGDNTRTHASHRGTNSQDIIRKRSQRSTESEYHLEQFWQDAQEEAESRKLLDAFGLTTIPRPRKRGEEPVEPPEFMMDLYRQLMETAGATGPAGPEGIVPSGPRANTVRCFNVKGASWAGHKRFVFETTGVLSRESVLSAELRLYKRPTRREQNSAPGDQVTLQIFHVYTTIDRVKPRKRLVDERSVNVTFSGWLQFNVTGAFHPVTPFPEALLTGDSTIKEFQIKIKNNDDDLKRNVLFTKVPKRKRHQNRKPLLVLFLNDNAIAQKDINLPAERGSGEVGTSPDVVVENVEYNGQKTQHENSKRELSVSDYHSNNQLERSTDIVKRDSLYAENIYSRTHRTDDHRNETKELRIPQNESDERTRRRRRRASSSSRRANQRLGRNKCQLYDFYVDFQKVGWSDWIIAPNGYTANYCEGYCPFPLDPHFNATNHATVQAILHTRGFTRKGNRLPNPCCVPDKFESIHVLYLDDFNNVVLKEFDDMVATSCGCH